MAHCGRWTLAVVFAAFLGAKLAAGALTGLALPPLEVSAVQAFGSWASANSLVFTDLMKHSAPFSGTSRKANSTDSWGYLSPSAIAWRPDGYPAGFNASKGSQWSVVSVIGAGKAYYTPGRYVVLYDGEGTLDLDGDAAWPPASSAPGRMEVDIAPNTTIGLRVRITSSSPANPLVNLRIVPAAYEATYNTTQVFHPDFLEMLNGIPLLRFAAWMKATADDQNRRAAPRDWAARTTPSHATQTFREADGVAVEHLVQLANMVNASMWVNLPRAANSSDPYTYGMVSYIATNLLPHLNLTVEYGIDGPGWLSTNLPVNTRLISGIARRAWVDAGRQAGQLRVVMTAPKASVLGNLFNNVPGGMNGNWSFIDAIAMPASFGSQEYWVWSERPNPTSWASPEYLANWPNPSLEGALKYIRSSVIAADSGWNRNFQLLRSLGIPLVGYAAGPDLLGPSYGARGNYDHAWQTCGGNVTFPCTLSNLYPPMTWWSGTGGPKSKTWATREEFNASFYGGDLALNASREAALESVLRQARLHDRMYDMVIDSLWRWHNQMGGGDIVVDLTRRTTPCSSCPGARTGPRYVPDECKAYPNATAAIVGRPTETPTYRALMAWLAAAGPDASRGPNATIGALPRSSATAPTAVPAPLTCSPACVYGSCVNGTCVCWAGVSGATCATLPAEGAGGTPSACNQRVGMNLDGISDWARSWTFVDVFKASRAWIPQSFKIGTPWDTGTPVNLINRTDGPGGRTAVGYPATLRVDQRVSTMLMRDLMTHVPGGVYTVLYDGKGILEFSMYDVFDAVQVEAGHATVTFRPSTDFNNGILVTIDRTDPADPIRNIRVIMPGYEQAAEYGKQPFHPALLWYLRPFGVLRFMSWMHTNDEDTPREWEERPLPQDRSFAVHRGGVPLEFMLLLSNMLGADPWFTLPHAASDDYVAKFASAVRDGLRPDLKVYVEYGNELWHTGFAGGQYAQVMGLKMNLTEQGNAWYGGINNEARLCFAGQRTANVSKIWKGVWGNRSSSVVVVVSGQSVWPITSSKLLSCGRAHENIDALAIGPYFGSYNKTRDTNLTKFVGETLPSQIDDILQKHIPQHAAIAKNYSKILLTYEAGQGLVGDGSSSDLAIQANRHPAMAGLYLKYMRGLAASNVSRIVHFSGTGAYTKSGSWGLMEAMDWDKRNAPKYQGLMAYLNSTLTCALPPAPDPATCPGGCSGHGECMPGGRCLCYSGYVGDDCNTTNFVEVRQCGYYCTFGQGTCDVSRIEDITRYWNCTCKPGIRGLQCSINSCPNDCNLNGDCLDQGICGCYPGYSGEDCSHDCGCGGHGRCDDSGGCVCDVGWRKAANGTCEWDCRGCDPGTSCIAPGECGCAEKCVYGDCFHGACRCWAGFGGPACNVSEAQAAVGGSSNGTSVEVVPQLNRGSLAGVNMAGVSYWSTQWVWLDVMKSSSRWLTTNAADTVRENLWDTGVPLELRPDGYPTHLPNNTVAHKLLLRDMQLHVWPGRYVVLYDGEGRLDFDYDAKVASRAKNRMEIVVTPTADLACAATGAAYCGDNGVHLILTATNPANPLRNIRILPLAPGIAGSAGGPGAGGAWEGRVGRAVFHPWFLKSIARYRTIRFMPWTDTNNNASYTEGAGSAWPKRTTPNMDTQARPGGAAPEHMVQLCNLVGADPWVNIHHLADDAQVTALATLVRDSLRPDVNVYVEHSNEVWNGLFPQYQYAASRGLALNLSTDARNASSRYHALRTVQIGDIFKRVFASAPGGGAARIKVVLGGWGYLCGGYCGERVVANTLVWNNTAAKVDFYGVAGYWDCGLGASGAKDVLLTVEQMVAQCNATLSKALADAEALAASIAPYRVPMITYEAGPSIVEASAIERDSMTAGLAPKFIALNRHPAMYELYIAYMEVFRRAGFVGEGRPWMQFVTTAQPGIHGSWGLQEYTGQSIGEAHKYRALMDWLDNQANYTRGADATGPLRRPLCMSLRAAGGPAAGVSGTAGGGGVGLGEGMLAGPPAVMLPAAGQVLVQGRTAAVRWATVGLPEGPSRPLNITLWLDTDCATEPPSGPTQQDQQRPAVQAVAVLASNAVLSPAGELNWRVPLTSESPELAAAVATAASSAGSGRRPAPRFFIRISDGVTTNYSEPFDVQPPYMYSMGPWSPCNCTASAPQQTRNVTCIDVAAAVTAATGAIGGAAGNASQVLPLWTPLQTVPTCSVFPKWNLTPPFIPTDPICSFTSIGCRIYRTSNVPGQWYWSQGKPVTDCTAQSSPWPMITATTASASLMTPPTVALDLCAAQGSGQAQSATQACPANACALPSDPSAPPPPPPSPPPFLSSPPPPPSSSPPSSGLPPPLSSPPPPSSSPTPSLSSPPPPPSSQPSPSPSALPTSSLPPPPSSSPPPPPSSSPPPPPSSSPPPPPSSSPPPPPSSSPPPPLAVPYCSLTSTSSLLSQLNAGAAACDPASGSSSSPTQCGPDSVCMAVQGCKRWACNTTTQSLVQVGCSGVCQPLTLSPYTARISDDGRSVAVALTARAAPLVLVLCTTIFDATSAALLGGGGALCGTTSDGTVLTVRLPANASLVANQTLALLPASGGQKLVGAVDSLRVFAGSVKVQACTSCVLPSAFLSGPRIISRTSCLSAAGDLLSAALSAPTAAFDASGSTDPSGRATWADVRWVLSSGGSASASIVLQAAVNRVNGLSDVSNRLRLELNSTEQAALQEAVSYTLKVTVTSWLSTSATASVSFTLMTSNPAPVVSVVGPAVQTFRIAAGVRLSAEVVGGGCKGRTLTWSWTSPSGWSALPSGGVAGQQLVLRGPVSGAVHGQDIAVQVTAGYEGASGGGVSSAAEVVLQPESSSPLASLTGPAGDVPDNTPLVLNATASSDPDSPASPRQSLSYQWDCRRDDYPNPCFSSSQQGDQTSSQGVWTIPAGLLTTGRSHTITVTVIKDVANTTAQLTVSASLTFRPRSASQPFPRGTLTRQCSSTACLAPHSTDRDLAVLLQLASPYDTVATAAAVSVVWGSPEAAAVSGLAAVSSATNSDLPAGAFLLTIPAATLPASQSDITVTADLSASAIDGAAAATGSATVTIQLNGAPYCGLNATDPSGCLEATIVNATFPFATVVLRARGWADAGQEGSQLKYEFGVRRSVTVGNGATAITDLVQQRGGASSATLVGLPRGVVQLYGCAIDKFGARTCGRVSVTVDPPATGFNATAALAAVNIAELVAANDQRTLLQAANQAAQLAAAAANTTGSNATAVSEVLGDLSVALVQSVINAGSLTDGEQAPQIIATMASLASSVTALPATAQEAYMRAIMSAVQTLPGGNSSSDSNSLGQGLYGFVTQLCRLLGASLPQFTPAPVSTTARRSLLTSATATAETARLRLKDMLAASDQLGNALGLQAAPRTPYLASGDGGAFVSAAAVPDASGSGSTAKTGVQLAAGSAAVATSTGSGTSARRRRSLAAITASSSNAEAQLVLAGAAATAAAGYGIDLQYAPSSAAALSTALYGTLPSSVTLLGGGLTTVTWNAGPGAAATPPILDGSTSYLLLTLPVPGYNSTRAVACLLYDVTMNTVTGNLSGLTTGDAGATAAAPSYDATTGRVTCRTNAVGSYLVAQGQAATAIPTSGITATKERGKDHTNVGAIVGGVLGGVGGLLVIALIVGFVMVRRSRRRVAPVQVVVQPAKEA